MSNSNLPHLGGGASSIPMGRSPTGAERRSKAFSEGAGKGSEFVVRLPLLQR